MFKLLLVAIATYVGYSFYQRMTIKKKVDKSNNKENSNNKYKDVSIRDAEFRDIDEK